MADTFVKIATVTVGAGGASSIDFASIPSTYTDLQVLISGRTSAAAAYDALTLSLNSSSSSFTSVWMYGNPPGGSAASGSNGFFGGLATGSTATSSIFGNTSIYIPNYAGSTNKSFSVDAAMENNSNTSFPFLIAGLWSNTAAITSLSLAGSSSFVEYSTATLYGISNS